MQAAVTTRADVLRYVGDGYDEFRDLLTERVAKATGTLFQVSRDNLFDIFLANLPEHDEHYNCHCCRRFFDNFGGLVSIDENGKPHSILWQDDDVPPYFTEAVRVLRLAVESARVAGVFLSSDRIWGTPQTGLWTHFHGHRSSVFRHAVLSADQKMAEKKEDFAMLRRGLDDYPITLAKQALAILESDTFPGSEKVVGIGRWFVQLHEAITRTRILRQKENLVWLAVATAPEGHAHIRSTMISTLLDDLKNNVPLDIAKKKWAEKMHPLQYARPQAPPKAGTIDRAEKLFEQLGAAASLNRRFARMTEVKTIWTPQGKARATPEEGVFGKLRTKPKKNAPITVPSRTMTFAKFRREVMPAAIRIEAYAPARGSYFAFTTAVDVNAPAMLQWDGLEGRDRNPVSWYQYVHGSEAVRWGVKPCDYIPVTALCLPPHQWQDPGKFPHMMIGLGIVLAGCREIGRFGMIGHGGLFPELLRNEYREVRSVVEAHANSTPPSGRDDADACGLFFSGKENIVLCVTTADSTGLVTLDRWD